jgi:hypothetical protein
MFYLKTFYQAMWDLRVRGLSFILLTLGLILFAANKQMVGDLLAKKEKANNPYFNALIDRNVNTDGIIRKLKNLPGVVDVKLKSTQQLEKDVKNMVKDLDSSVMDNLLNVNYHGIKVELGKSLEGRSQKLVQEYLNRLVGKESVTMTGVKTPVAKKKAVTGIEGQILKWADVILIISLSIVWVFACWTMSRTLLTRSYLIEKFQRKNMVAFKSFLTGMTSMAMVAFTVMELTGGNFLNAWVLIIPLAAIGLTFNTKQLSFNPSR